MSDELAKLKSEIKDLKEELSKIDSSALSQKTVSRKKSVTGFKFKVDRVKILTIMEETIVRFGGEVAGEAAKDRCCGGNQIFIDKSVTEKLSRIILEKSRGTLVVFCPLCHMALKTFSGERKVIYFTDLLLYIMGEKGAL